MNFYDILTKEYSELDKFMAKSCRIICYCYLFCWILNGLGIFTLEPIHMAILGIITIPLMFIPTILFKTCQNKNLIRYITITILTLYIGIGYSILSFQVILFFTIPLVLISSYGKKRLQLYTNIIFVIIISIAHVANYYVSALPSREPYTIMHEILLLSLLPRIIIYFMFVSIFSAITKRNNRIYVDINIYTLDLYNTQYEIVKAFTEISESKSGQTGQHIKRVAQYMSLMSDKLEIKDSEKDAFVIASMMHDIGKLLVNSNILDKKGTLTDVEFEEIKKHTEYGYALLKNSPGRVMKIAKQMARYHHEHWDGNGYNKMAGEQIDYYSRIMALVDVFDALISTRSYKKAWAPKDVYNEICNQSGKQFDPIVVKAFCECYPDFLKIVDRYKDR